jgi:processive 1,2-diacylglycerol beta-glucosyltransferase
VNRRNVLVLSGRFGKGHDTVAEAVAAALAPLDVNTRIVDSISLLGGAGSVLGERVFRTLLSRPAVYDAFHFGQLRTGGWLARRLDAAALSTMKGSFTQLTEEFRPSLILSVFATGAAAGAWYAGRHPGVATAVLITDSYAHRMWVHDGTDLFLVTSALCANAVRSFRPDANVVVVTHPTRTEFYDPPDRATARRRLGIPTDVDVALFMSGAWGIGPVAECAAALAADNVWVLAVAGNNRRLHRRMVAAARHDSRLLPFGFTDEMPTLMAASDVVITSSGDTCREARVVGRPLVLLDVVPGHGRENLMHELELGHAAVAQADPRVLTSATRRVLADPHLRELAAVTSPAAWEQELRSALASIGFG